MQQTPVRILGRRLATLALLGLALGTAACSDDDDDGGGNTGVPASTTYAGYVSSTTGGVGPLNITFASAVKAPPARPTSVAGPSFAYGAPVNATGTVSLGGAPVAITGTVNEGVFHMEGGGWVLDGNLSNGMITGTFTAPGAVTGSLSAIASSEGSPAQVFCGYYEGTDLTNEESVEGSFSMVVAGTVVMGTAVDEDNEDPIDFAGTAKPSEGTFTVDMSADGGRLVVDGSYGETGAAGTFDTYAGSTHVQTGEFYGWPDCTPI